MSISKPGSHTMRVDEFLKYAVTNNEISILQNVLKNEDVLTSTPVLGYELINKAIRLHYREIVHLLLDKNCRLFMKFNINTPLHLAAAKYDWLDVIERMVEKGARVGLKNSMKETPLHIAFAVNSSNEKTDLLLRSYLRQDAQNIYNKDGLSFLHIACSRPHLDIVQKLVEANGDSVKWCTASKGITPLHMAVEYRRHEIVEYLIKNGANIYFQDSEGSTPFHLALKCRDIRMIDILFAHDTHKSNVINKYNISHFMVACAGSKKVVVKEYLDKAKGHTPLNDLICAKIKNLDSGVGYTALHFAVDLGHTEIVKFLLNYGADCCDPAAGELTPHMLAQIREHKMVYNVLQEHCYLAKKCRQTRAKSPDFEKYGDIYERGALIEQVRTLKHLQKTLNKLKNMDSEQNHCSKSNDNDSLSDSS